MSGPGQRTLYFLTGATAVGKTEWALRWAADYDAEILSCDSLLFYRGMDIGTAKPTPAERARVPHHLVDILGIQEPMNIARYAALAEAAVADIAGRGRRVLVTGGSGFYLKSFFAPASDGVVVPDPVREEVRLLERTGGPGALVRALDALNPSGLGSLDLSNPRRVSRALERCLATGLPLRVLAEAFARIPPPFADWEKRLVRLERPREELNLRIRVRSEAMVASGLVEEVRRILPDLASNPSAARAIGYREVIDALHGRAPFEGLAERIASNTRALVKKQMTWFRTQVPEHRVVRAADLASAADLFVPMA